MSSVSNPTRRGRIAGIDYGTVRIGIAVSDIGQTLASPHSQHNRCGEAGDAKFFKRLADEEQIKLFVVGLPVFTSGDESPKSLEARRFGAWLTEATKVPVTFYDERYTTAQAEDALLAAELTSKQRKKRRDMLAAQIILASYLESKRNTDHRPEALDD